MKFKVGDAAQFPAANLKGAQPPSPGRIAIQTFQLAISQLLERFWGL
jgi:hypothetical protein